MDPRSDQELIAAYRHGDEAALAFLIRRHIGPLHRFLARLIGDAHAAEDLAQETFFKAWKRLSSYDASKPFRPWLFTIAQRTAIDELRKKKALPFSDLQNDEQPPVEESIPDEQPLPSAWLENKELAAALEDALTTLTPKARSVVLLHETEDLTFEEIAQIMDEPMNTVKSRYRRATLALRAYLQARLSS